MVTYLYCFGVEYGDGTDDEHFHVGFTCKKMLARAKGAEVFHVDGTYRILKISYPLIVLGVSDIDRWVIHGQTILLKATILIPY